MSELLTAALAYAAVGRAVVPVHSIIDGACSCNAGAACKSPGKHPTTAHGLKDATTDPEVVCRWWERRRHDNVGMLTDGLVVIDIDPRHGGDASLEALVSELGPLPPTVEASTGGGGRHLFFVPRTPMRNRTNVRPGIDVRADGGYVVAAPSVHASGGTYRWVEGRALGAIDVAVIPERWEQLLCAADKRTTGAAICEGERNDELTSIGGRLRSKGESEEAIAERLLKVNRDRCQPPLDESEVRAIAKSVARYAPKKREKQEDEKPEPPDLEEAAPALYTYLDEDLARLARRRAGEELPVPLPFKAWADAMGGGLWPGLHVLAAPTGTGKSQLALSIIMHAARNGYPVLVIGLELDRLQMTSRFLGILGSTSWSDVYLGRVAPNMFAIEALREALPIRVAKDPRMGWSYDLLLPLVEEMTKAYGRPPLVLVDFLQLVGSPPKAREDMRERVGKAAYAARLAARDHGATMLVISSVGREQHDKLIGAKANLGTGNPARFVGAAKEAGEVELAADSLSVMGRDPTDGSVWIAIAKLRTGPAAWVRLLFDGQTFTDAPVPASEEAGDDGVPY